MQQWQGEKLLKEPGQCLWLKQATVRGDAQRRPQCRMSHTGLQKEGGRESGGRGVGGKKKAKG